MEQLTMLYFIKAKSVPKKKIRNKKDFKKIGYGWVFGNINK